MLGSTEIIILLIAVLVAILPFWKIFSKAGFFGSLSHANAHSVGKSDYDFSPCICELAGSETG